MVVTTAEEQAILKGFLKANQGGNRTFWIGGSYNTGTKKMGVGDR